MICCEDEIITNTQRIHGKRSVLRTILSEPFYLNSRFTTNIKFFTQRTQRKTYKIFLEMFFLQPPEYYFNFYNIKLKESIFALLQKLIQIKRR